MADLVSQYVGCVWYGEIRLTGTYAQRYPAPELTLLRLDPESRLVRVSVYGCIGRKDQDQGVETCEIQIRVRHLDGLLDMLVPGDGLVVCDGSGSAKPPVDERDFQPRLSEGGLVIPLHRSRSKMFVQYVRRYRSRRIYEIEENQSSFQISNSAQVEAVIRGTFGQVHKG